MRKYKVMLNPQKSVILRILNRAGKTKKICANIPEAKEYKYLGININQSLNFKELIKKIKIKSKYLKYNLKKVKNTKLTPRSKDYSSKQSISKWWFTVEQPCTQEIGYTEIH